MSPCIEYLPFPTMLNIHAFMFFALVYATTPDKKCKKLTTNSIIQLRSAI